MKAFAEAAVELFDDTERQRKRIDQLLDHIQAEGAKILAQKASWELPGAIERVVRQRDRRLVLWHAVILLWTLVVGVGAGWVLARYGV
jgi:hypothetical protein